MVVNVTAQSLKPQIDRPELFFGLVGAIGTDLLLISDALTEALLEIGYSAEVIKLSDLLDAETPVGASAYDRYIKRMKAGTALRNDLMRGDAVVLMGLGDIWRLRAEGLKNGRKNEMPKPLSGTAYIFNQLKHPEEVKTLRKIYGDSFFLIGGYSPREVRVKNLADRIAKSKFVVKSDEFRQLSERLIETDKNEAGEKLGQRVQDTFPEADIFVNVEDKDSAINAIGRFVELLFGYPFHTPTRDEFAMFQARAAALRSCDLGRQVGAVIATIEGDIISLGTNEVPKAGGGQYWYGDEPDRRDFQKGQDSNTEVKRNFLRDVLEKLSKADWLADRTSKEIDDLVQKTFSDEKSFLSSAQLMSLIAYFRAVHAEMSCLMDAAKRGVATFGQTLICTTFPCHECARHIVAAGVSRVVYIDPYPKSLTPDLYPDSIAVDASMRSSTHVTFEPFVGIAPRRYMSLFDASDLERKDYSGAAAKWKSKEAVPRIYEQAESYLFQEQMLNLLMNNFLKAKEASNVKKGTSQERVRAGRSSGQRTAGLAPGNSKSKSSAATSSKPKKVGSKVKSKGR